MRKSALIQARIEPQLKKEADNVIHPLGLTAAQVVSALYAQIALKQAIPFELKLPNKATLTRRHSLQWMN